MEQVQNDLRKGYKHREKKNTSYLLMTVVFFVSGMFIVSALFTTIPLHPVFAADLQLSLEQAALVTSVCSFCYAMGTIVFAPLSDRLGRKKVILFGLFALAVISPIIGMVSTYGLILVFRGIQGFFAASFAPTALTFITELFPDKKRAVAIGFISAGFLMAGIVGQVYSGLIHPLLNWSAVFYILGLIYLGLACLFYVSIPTDANVALKREKRSIFRAFTNVLSSPFFLSCYFVTILILMSFGGMYSTFETFLSDIYHLSSTEILFVRSAGIVGMLVAPFGGRLVGRFGGFKMMRFGLFLAAIGMFFIGMTNNLTVLIVTSIFFTAGISITVPALISTLGSYGGRERATAMSLYSFFLFVGSTIGPILAVTLMKEKGYFWAFEGISLLLAIGFIVTFIISYQAKSRQIKTA